MSCCRGHMDDTLDDAWTGSTTWPELGSDGLANWTLFFFLDGVWLLTILDDKFRKNDEGLGDL